MKKMVQVPSLCFMFYLNVCLSALCYFSFYMSDSWSEKSWSVYGSGGLGISAVTQPRMKWNKMDGLQKAYI